MRLIDADELMKDRVENDPVRIAVMHSPTAYDVDKVVERLEILSDRADDKIMEQEGSEQYFDGFGDGIDEAIKILKSGGIE